jgi:hypothetical protein
MIHSYVSFPVIKIISLDIYILFCHWLYCSSIIIWLERCPLQCVNLRKPLSSVSIINCLHPFKLFQLIFSQKRLKYINTFWNNQSLLKLCTVHTATAATKKVPVPAWFKFVKMSWTRCLEKTDVPFCVLFYIRIYMTLEECESESAEFQPSWWSIIQGTVKLLKYTLSHYSPHKLGT